MEIVISNDEYTIKNHKIPEDGEYWSDSIKVIFSKSVQEKIFKDKIDNKAIMRQILEQAQKMEW